jgi:hypothetical protein
MDTVLTLLGAAGIWLFRELAGSLLAELVRPIFHPLERIFTLVGRIFTRLVNGWTVALLWTAGAGSFVLWPVALKSDSPVVRTSALAAFLFAIPVALMAMLTWRHKPRPRLHDTDVPLIRLRGRSVAPRPE